MQQIDFVRLLTGMTTTGESVRVSGVGRTEQERTALLDADFPMIAPRLLAICRALGGDAAEDPVQDTYLLARKQIGQLRDLDALEPWLTTIAVRQCIRHHRRRLDPGSPVQLPARRPCRPQHRSGATRSGRGSAFSRTGFDRPPLRVRLQPSRGGRSARPVPRECPQHRRAHTPATAPTMEGGRP